MNGMETEPHVVTNGVGGVKTENKDEDFDKDSGNHSGEDMEAEGFACEEKVVCDLDKDGPHCHIDGSPTKTKSNPNSRKNSIAEELKAKIASVSRRNSFGSRRSSLTGSRRGSIQSIKEVKEDVTCEAECEAAVSGPHCHVEAVPDPTCQDDAACPDPSPHCHVEKIDDPTCVENKDCPEASKGDHCHVDTGDNTDGQGRPVSGDDDSDVIADLNGDIPDDRKQFLQTNSPGLVSAEDPAAVNKEPESELESPGVGVPGNSPLTPQRKIIQTPVNMKEVGPGPEDSSVTSAMPPTEHSPAVEPVVTKVQEANEKVAVVTMADDKENKMKTLERRVKTPSSETQSQAGSARLERARSKSKSRPSSPSSESRRSRFSSKERKISGLEKLNHDLPDVSNVKSKLDDKNLDYKPPTSTKRIEVRKLNWRAESKIMNNNLDYKKKALQVSMENGIDKAPKKIENHKLEWKAEAKTVTRNTAYTPPSKSEKKIETFKVNWSAESKLNTRENINYKAGEAGTVSPTRSATAIRRQRSRSSHGPGDRSSSSSVKVTQNGNRSEGGVKETVLGLGGVPRQSASAVPAHRTATGVN